MKRVYQLTRNDGFLQIGNTTSPQGLRACGRVVEARHEDDRNGRPGCFEALSQSNSGKPAKMNVQKKAIHLPHGVVLNKCLG